MADQSPCGIGQGARERRPGREVGPVAVECQERYLIRAVRGVAAADAEHAFGQCDRDSVGPGCGQGVADDLPAPGGVVDVQISVITFLSVRFGGAVGEVGAACDQQFPVDTAREGTGYSDVGRPVELRQAERGVPADGVGFGQLRRGDPGCRNCRAEEQEKGQYQVSHGSEEVGGCRYFAKPIRSSSSPSRRISDSV